MALKAINTGLIRSLYSQRRLSVGLKLTRKYWWCVRDVKKWFISTQVISRPMVICSLSFSIFGFRGQHNYSFNHTHNYLYLPCAVHVNAVVMRLVR